jgi:hypothetical protein
MEAGMPDADPASVDNEEAEVRMDERVKKSQRPQGVQIQQPTTGGGPLAS